MILRDSAVISPSEEKEEEEENKKRAYNNLSLLAHDAL